MLCSWSAATVNSGNWRIMKKTKKKLSSEVLGSEILISDISVLIEKAREHVAREYNVSHLVLNWMIGKRIEAEVLKYKRGEYGEQIIIEISKILMHKYGAGYSRPNLFRMVKFAKLFNKEEIVSTVSRQLSWSHLIIICSIEEEIKRKFYTEMCKVQKWSVRDLQKQIKSMLYERTAISKEPELVARASIQELEDNGKLSSSMIFKDPYFMDFIGDSNYFNERDLENLILDNITSFLQELGSEFCFVARQKRMSTSNKDRYLEQQQY
jgi:predicted nuclease of restriction endonuclease-like (RecB) superfamily